MTDLEKNFTNKESEFVTWVEPGGSNYSGVVDDKLSRQVQLHFTASIDLTLFTTDWDVLHKRGDEGKLWRQGSFLSVGVVGS